MAYQGNKTNERDESNQVSSRSQSSEQVCDTKARQSAAHYGVERANIAHLRYYLEGYRPRQTRESEQGGKLSRTHMKLIN